MFADVKLRIVSLNGYAVILYVSGRIIHTVLTPSFIYFQYLFTLVSVWTYFVSCLDIFGGNVIVFIVVEFYVVLYNFVWTPRIGRWDACAKDAIILNVVRTIFSTRRDVF